MGFSLPLILANCAPVGGQAVMEGVMMRNGDVYGLAVRQDNGEICAQRLPWRSITKSAWARLPFVRGFPVLLETMINGIHALNHSLELANMETPSKGGFWRTALSLSLALLMAIALFVIAPHMLSFLMMLVGFGGDVEGLSFHLWDGFFKCAIFVGYIWAISFVPDIRRVFEYHGAEHKTIHAWEETSHVNTARACGMSRLHPRCGTTFLLFVICISIVLQAILVPLFLKLWPANGMLAKHALSIGFKLLLVIPISAVAYELIRFAARLPAGPVATILQAPGLALQRLTTCEPNQRQIDVAIVALAEALGPDLNADIQVAPYSRLADMD